MFHNIKIPERQSCCYPHIQIEYHNRYKGEEYFITFEVAYETDTSEYSGKQNKGNGFVIKLVKMYPLEKNGKVYQNARRELVKKKDFFLELLTLIHGHDLTDNPCPDCGGCGDW